MKLLSNLRNKEFSIIQNQINLVQEINYWKYKGQKKSQP